MSHQVIITFDLDENKVQEHAEKEAGRLIAKDISESVFNSGYYNNHRKEEFVQQAVKDIIEKEKDKIIAEAIKTAVSGLLRSKTFKDKLEGALNDLD